MKCTPLITLSVVIVVFTNAAEADNNPEKNLPIYNDQENQHSNKSLESRSVFNLMRMVWSQFSWSELFCLLKTCLPGTGNDMCHYGCYCGLGDTPRPPQNGIDSICYTHDLCWTNLRTNKNCSAGHWEDYDWDLVDGKILCDETGSNSECELGYCKCDKQIVEDLRTEFDLLGSECPIDPGCPE